MGCKVAQPTDHQREFEVMRMMRPIVLFGVLAMTGCTLHVDRATTLKSGFPHGSVYSVDGDVQVAPLARLLQVFVETPG